MASTRLDVSVEPDLVSAQVRDLILASARFDDVLDLAPLRFSLHIPIRTTPAARARPDKLLPALERRLEGEVADAFAAVRKDIDKDVTGLAESLRKLVEKDGTADAAASEQAAKLVKGVAARLDAAADGLPAGVREAIGKVMRTSEFQPCFSKQKLASVGTWGFQRRDGIRLKAGVFQAGANDADDAGPRLWHDLSAARSHPRKFVLVAGGALGLAVGTSVSAGDVARARAMSQGGGTPLQGEVDYRSGAYHFQLDKAGSQGKRERLAKKVRERVRDLCKKNIAVRFDDEDRDDQQPGDE